MVYTIDIDFAEDTSIFVPEADDSPRDSPQRSARRVERKEKKNDDDDDDRIHRRLPIKWGVSLSDGGNRERQDTQDVRSR